MNIKTLLLATTLLLVQHTAYADCDDPEAPADCIEISGNYTGVDANIDLGDSLYFNEQGSLTNHHEAGENT